MLNKHKPRWGTITNRGLRLFVKNNSCKIKKTLSLTKIVSGHNIDLGNRVILRPMYSGKSYRCKTITLSRTNIDLGHRGQIVLFFCSMSKVYVSEGNCSVFCSCNSRFWKINIRPQSWFSQFRGLCLFNWVYDILKSHIIQNSTRYQKIERNLKKTKTKKLCYE